MLTIILVDFFGFFLMMGLLFYLEKNGIPAPANSNNSLIFNQINDFIKGNMWLFSMLSLYVFSFISDFEELTKTENTGGYQIVLFFIVFLVLTGLGLHKMKVKILDYLFKVKSFLSKISQKVFNKSRTNEAILTEKIGLNETFYFLNFCLFPFFLIVSFSYLLSKIVYYCIF